MVRDPVSGAEWTGAHDAGVIGLCAFPHSPRLGDGDLVDANVSMGARCHAVPENPEDVLGEPAPINIGSAEGSCDSRTTVASVLSSSGTVAAAGSSDVGDDASFCGLDGGRSTARTNGQGDDRATLRRHSSPHSLSAGIKGGSRAIQKTRAKKLPAPRSCSGAPASLAPSFLPLGMMAAALSRDLAERKAIAQQKNKTKVKKEAGSQRGRS